MVMTYQPNNGEKTKNGLIGTIIVFLIISFCALYFFEINSVASLGFDIKAQEREIDKLKNDNQKIKLALAEFASMKKINDIALAEKLNLVNISSYQYLLISEHSGLAKK